MSVQDATDCDVAVVLAPPGSEKAAVRALAGERSWRVVATSDPMGALAEIALADRAAKARAAWDEAPAVENQTSEESVQRSVASGPLLGDRDEGSTSDCPPTSDRSVSFVLAHPRKWAMRHEMIEAVTRYFPNTRLFAFDERGLREGRPSRKARRSEVRSQRSEVRGQEPSAGSTGRPRTAKPSEPAISRDEIDMLLGGEAR